MMHPESLPRDKANLDLYDQECEEFNSGCFQRMCCFKPHSQFCPKCGTYHKSSSSKHCLCLTLTTLVACIFFVALLSSITLHINDPKSGYEVIQHMFTIITRQEPEPYGGSNSTQSVSTAQSNQSKELVKLNEFVADISNKDFDHTVTELSELDAEMFNPRMKRSVLKSEKQPDESEDLLVVNADNYLDNSQDSRVGEKYEITLVGGEDITRVEGLTFAPQIKQIPGPSDPVTTLTEATNSHDYNTYNDDQKPHKRSPSFENKSPVENIYYDSKNFKTAKTMLPVTSSKIQSPIGNWPYPPTGPDGSNFAESVKTSQQLTVANNQVWKPVCFRAPNSQAVNPTSYVCIPLMSHSGNPYQNPFPNYAFNTDPSLNKGMPDSNNEVNPTLPTMIAANENSQPTPSQPTLIIPPPTAPQIQIPTAIASPNPYYFPTFNGAPIMPSYTFDSHPTAPQFNNVPQWPFRGFQNSPFQSFGSQYYIQPPTGPQGLNWPNNLPRAPQPQFQMMPPHPPTDFQNPIFCMYVPVQTHQFPVVNGVTEIRNRKSKGDPQISEPKRIHHNYTLDEAVYKSAKANCEQDEFACTRGDMCIPERSWCDGQVDCPDASDEILCSCKHRVDKQRLCDGFFDCPSGEDELGCFGCDDNSFSCLDWERGREESTCVPLSKRCDNEPDCLNGRDEQECALLAEAIIPHKAHFVSFTSGLLHRNWKGRWYPACTGPVVTNWAIDACEADVGQLTREPFVEMVLTEYPGPFIIPNSADKYELSHMCQEQRVVTHVTCPPVKCGTRLFRSTPNLSEIPSRPMTQFRNNNNLEEPEVEKDYCENCNSKSQDPKVGGLMLAKKKEEYQTQFEPQDRNDMLDYLDGNRWKRNDMKVVGGRESKPGSWPWLVAIYQDGIFHCGGVIVNEVWVMTAAHCVDSYHQHYYEVQAGMLRRFSFSPQEQTRSVSHVLLHSLYNREDMHNDLALLRMKQPLQFNRWVRPICLPDDTEYSPSPGTLCTAVGWGATREHGPDPDHMHEVSVPILPYCKHRVDQEGAQICAGYLRGGHDTCQGDSGGPLLCRLPGEDNRWYVAGVVSHGEGCARPDEPGVYTRVFLFVNWINSIVNEPGNTFSDRQKPLQKCPGQQCSSDRRCVPPHKVCDLHVDCLNAEDETSFCTDEFTSTLLLTNPGDNGDSEETEDVSTSTQSSPDYFSYNDSNDPFRNVDSSDVTKANRRKESTESSTVPVTTTDISRDTTTEVGTDQSTATEAIRVQSTTTDTSTVQPMTTEISNIKPTTTNSRAVTTDSYSYDTTTLSNLNPEDIQIIDELIHKPQNSSSFFDSTQNSSVKIPPYLVDILFSTTFPPTLDHVSNKTNQTNYNATYDINNKKNNVTDVKVPDLQPTTGAPRMGLETQPKSTTPPKNVMESDPFKYYYREENRKLYENMCKQLLEHKDSKVEPNSDTGSVSLRNDQTSTPIPDIVVNGNDTFNNTKNNTTKFLPSYLNNNLFICKRLQQPLLKKRRCDGFVDCEDGSDEEDCSCKERLLQSAPQLICDGQVNCFDKTDELNCKWKCEKKEFFCSKSKMCIPRTKRCDGKQDCTRGDDEENCYALISGEKVKLDRNREPVFSEEGLLAVFSQGAWRPKCLDRSESINAAFTACYSLGFRGYESFREVRVKDAALSRISARSKDDIAECIGLRVKCFSWREGTPWLGSLLVEGQPKASAVLVNSSWLTTHKSVCEQLDMRNNYIEVLLGHNYTFTPRVQTLYEQRRRVDFIETVKGSNVCLLHLELPTQFNKRVRPLQLPFIEEDNNKNSHLYAIYLTESGPQKLNITVTETKKICDIDNICFTLSKPPAECYMDSTFSENGYLVMESMLGSRIVSHFGSYKIFCDTTEQDFCVDKLSSFLPIISARIDDKQVSSTPPPYCDGIRCGKCVGWSQVADGATDCYNHMDESPSSFSHKQSACQVGDTTCGRCKVSELRCRSGQCVDKSRFCDRVIDCSDGSDEPADCRNSCVEFLKLAAPQKLCDGVRNCFDKSDETWDLCHETACDLPNAYYCKRNKKCIPPEFVCDGNRDCPDGDDEQNCVGIQQLQFKENEGIISRQRFGDWTHMCFNETQVDFTSMCENMGYNKAVHKMLVSSNSTSYAPDSFSPVQLNDQTSIVIRKGRPLLEVDFDKKCLYVYVKCV